jgi:8-oxo-dGTP pyrophosphatase MutT (NUDIX family)
MNETIHDNCDALRQAGCIPFRVVEGGVEILLVTSRGTGRWIIPKGFVEKSETGQAAALKEAHEEAGATRPARSPADRPSLAAGARLHLLSLALLPSL